MAILSMECPHCRTPQSPLTSVGAFQIGERRLFMFFVCPVCEKPISAKLFMARAVLGAHSGQELMSWSKTTTSAGWDLEDFWPTQTDSAAPPDAPPQIARNFVQAEEAAARTHREAAGMAYRRVLELTLKDKAPDLKGTLEKRIDKLADGGRLTPDIKDWAHNIRDLGNEATHDEDEPTEDDIADMAAFTRVVLEYLYTMPAKVARRASSTTPAP